MALAPHFCVDKHAALIKSLELIDQGFIVHLQKHIDGSYTLHPRSME